MSAHPLQHFFFSFRFNYTQQTSAEATSSFNNAPKSAMPPPCTHPISTRVYISISLRFTECPTNQPDSFCSWGNVRLSCGVTRHTATWLVYVQLYPENPIKVKTVLTFTVIPGLDDTYKSETLLVDCFYI